MQGTLCYTVYIPLKWKKEENNMQIHLGEKIRELRKRDKRKQKDLAVALGVTSQAVSRWEANGGYPDIAMLPAIANYFHITIDELFGYDSDRQTKLPSHIEQADQISRQKDPAALIVFLRNVLSEFPSERQLQYRLGNALVSMGYKKSDPGKIVARGAALLNIIRNITLKMNAGKKRHPYLKKF